MSRSRTGDRVKLEVPLHRLSDSKKFALSGHEP